jgi:hypothetical protein
VGRTLAERQLVQVTMREVNKVWRAEFRFEIIRKSDGLALLKSAITEFEAEMESEALRRIRYDVEPDRRRAA